MHPYLDFNCRTFAVFMLNKELIRRDMLPSIMDDPEAFDYMTIEESVERIKQGQENYKYLVQNGKLHENDPDDGTMIENVKPIKGINGLFCINNDYLNSYVWI